MTRRQCIPVILDQYVNHDPRLIFEARLVFKARFVFEEIRYIVLSDTVITFKPRFDKFWQHEDVIYDFKAEIHGIGSRRCY